MGNDGMCLSQRQLHVAEDLVKALLLQERHEWFRGFVQGVDVIGYEDREDLEIPWCFGEGMYIRMV